MRRINGRSSTQLVGYCAQVDRRLATIDEKSRPGQYGDQLGSFASKARSHPPPQAQRQQFDILLTAIDDTVQQYRSAQAALSSGNTDAYQAALTASRPHDGEGVHRGAAVWYAASRRLRQGTGRAASRALPLLSLAGGWRLGSDSPFAVQQVGAAVLDGRIWVAGGLTGPEQCNGEDGVLRPDDRHVVPGPGFARRVASRDDGDLPGTRCG